MLSELDEQANIPSIDDLSVRDLAVDPALSALDDAAPAEEKKEDSVGYPAFRSAKADEEAAEDGGDLRPTTASVGSRPVTAATADRPPS